MKRVLHQQTFHFHVNLVIENYYEVLFANETSNLDGHRKSEEKRFSSQRRIKSLHFLTIHKMLHEEEVITANFPEIIMPTVKRKMHLFIKDKEAG